MSYQELIDTIQRAVAAGEVMLDDDVEIELLEPDGHNGGVPLTHNGGGDNWQIDDIDTDILRTSDYYSGSHRLLALIVRDEDDEDDEDDK